MTILFTTSMILLFLIVLIAVLTTKKIKERKKAQLDAYLSYLSPLQRTIYNILNKKIPSSDIIKKESLISKLTNEDGHNLQFITDSAQEAKFGYESNLSLNENSIFRNITIMKKVSNERDLKEVFKKDVAVYDNMSVYIDKVDNEIVYSVPINTTTFSVFPESFSTENDFKVYGKKVGEILATFENEIFISMLKIHNSTTYIENSEDLSSVYRACHRIIKNGAKDVLVLLPFSYTEISNILKEEVSAAFKNVTVTAIFVPDTSLYRQSVKAVVMENNPNLKIAGFHKGSIHSSCLLVDEKDICIQSAVNIGFAVSGLTNTCICTYNNKNNTKDNSEGIVI